MRPRIAIIQYTSDYTEKDCFGIRVDDIYPEWLDFETLEDAEESAAAIDPDAVLLQVAADKDHDARLRAKWRADVG